MLAAYVIHRKDLLDSEVTAIEGVPVVTLERAVRECAATRLAPDLSNRLCATVASEGC